MLSGVGLQMIAKASGMAVPDALLGEMIQIGLAVLVFTAGVELSPRRMRGRTKSIIIVAVSQFILLGLAGLVKTSGLGVFAYAVHKWCVPWITRSIKLDDEELMLVSLAMLFIFSGMAWLLELPFLVGALLAGFALSAFPMNGLVRGMLGSLSSFFLALFFISVGAFLTMPDLQMIGHSLIFIVVLIVVTIVFVSIIAELAGYSTRASIETGILLSQTSEFSLLLALMGVASGQINAQSFSALGALVPGSCSI